jgi:hypothetical protein
MTTSVQRRRPQNATAVFPFSGSCTSHSKTLQAGKAAGYGN